MPSDAAFPWLTADCPGIGGVIKQEPEDFVVEEIPAYEPSGLGEHLFLWMEKRDVSADQLAQHLARTLAVPRNDIGMGGLKDRRAVTRQWVSVPARCEPRVGEADSESIHVLRAARHGNKLKTGHLRGNRFTILVRDVGPEAKSRADAIALKLKALGFPNQFGDQRFGHEGQTLETGQALLRGEQTARNLPPSRRKFLLRLSLSAVQSFLFNLALAERLREDLIARVFLGDVMQVTASGGLFLVEDPAAEQRRFDVGEIVTTGPLFGPKMREPQGEVGEREAALLERQGLSAADFRRFARLTPGSRRPYLIRPHDLTIQETPNGLVFQVTLPPGVYATTLLREFQKAPGD